MQPLSQHAQWAVYLQALLPFLLANTQAHVAYAWTKCKQDAWKCKHAPPQCARTQAHNSQWNNTASCSSYGRPRCSMRTSRQQPPNIPQVTTKELAIEMRQRDYQP